MAVGGKGENIKVVIDLELTDESLKKAAKTGGVEIGGGKELSGKINSKKSDLILRNATTDAVQDKVGKIQTKAGNLNQLLTNPTGFITGRLATAIPVLGSLMALAFALPEIINAIGNMLFGAGGPFDRRFKRLIQKEYLGFLTREEQKRRALGLDPLIFSFNDGFGNSVGQRTTYSLEWTKEGQPFANYLDANDYAPKKQGTMYLTSHPTKTGSAGSGRFN